ncbi:MAG: YCF48-related protein [Acidobacteriota bacterium]
MFTSRRTPAHSPTAAWLGLLTLLLGVEPTRADEELPVVDLGRRALLRCGIGSLSLRHEELWSADGCGVRVSTDDGRSWTRHPAPELQADMALLAWPSPELGLASLDRGKLLFTQDGGLSWKESPVPFEVETLAWAGSRVWLHGDGLWSTDDRGERWESLEPTGPRLKCSDLDFIDESDGWCLGSRKLLATQDGGRSWTERATPPETGTRLVRLDEKEAWLFERYAFTRLATCWHTTDGGEHWRELGLLPQPEDAPFHLKLLPTDRGPRELLVTELLGRQPGAPSWVPWPASPRVVHRGEARVTLFHGHHVLLRHGEHLEFDGTPVLITETEERSLGGLVEDRFGRRWGFLDDRLFHHDEAVDAWLAFGSLTVWSSEDERFDELAWLSRRKGLALAEGGRIHRTVDAGRTWKPSRRAVLDRWELQRLLHERDDDHPLPRHPVEKLTAQPRGVLSLGFTFELEDEACFGDYDELVLSWTEHGGRLELWDVRQRNLSATLQHSTVCHWLDRIVGIARDRTAASGDAGPTLNDSSRKGDWRAPSWGSLGNRALYRENWSGCSHAHALEQLACEMTRTHLPWPLPALPSPYPDLGLLSEVSCADVVFGAAFEPPKSETEPEP